MTDVNAARDPELAHVLRLEHELQSAPVRANPERLRELLAPDFVEIGASGRRWTLASILGLLAEESSAADSDEIAVRDPEARHLTPDVVQVLWTSESAGRRARRASLWRREAAGWRLAFHQGTPIP